MRIASLSVTGLNLSLVAWKFAKPSRIYGLRYVSNEASDIPSPLIVRQRLINARAKSGLNYLASVVIGFIGLAFTAVPLFNVFCKATSFGGNVGDRVDAKRGLKRIPDRELTIQFVADKNARLQWNFRPLQTDIRVVPGETVLAFYTAENPTDEPISGISTYNVVPYTAAPYFNKIQCFCFDEQRLNPKEKVDMPVFFFIDPEYATDPDLQNVTEITLSYTFFEAREGLELPFMPKFFS